MKEEALFDVNVPTATDTYSPVSHKQIIEELGEQLDKTDIKVVQKNYRTMRKGRRVIGTWHLNAGNDEFNYQLAFQNSHDKSLPVAFVGGASVIVCSNGMVVGETKFIRKHTGTISEELSDRIQTVVSGLDKELVTAQKHAKGMKGIKLDPIATAELCGRWFMEQDILTAAQLNIIRDQLRNPDFEDFADPTLWSLYNHATHALKNATPLKYLDSYRKLHKFVAAEYKL